MDLEALKAGVLAPLTPGDLVPPPRFTSKRFDTYRTDPSIPGQIEAVTAVRRFAAHRETFLGKVFGRRGKAGVVKLQEGSLRCVVADEPPDPYRSIVVSIIVTGGKKPQAIALHGDVVRVVRSTDGSDTAHFDVRLSMRNSAETLAAYRSLIEKLGAQDEA